MIARYPLSDECLARDFLLIDVEAVHGSGPVDLWFNERLRKESRMSSDADMFDGSSMLTSAVPSVY